MKTKLIFLPAVLFSLFLSVTCTKDNAPGPAPSTDTLTVTHSMKGWELYSWQEGGSWHFSVLTGTNRLKTLAEVKSEANTSGVHLITVEGIDLLKQVLGKFPENEYITWIGQGWLKTCWGENYGDLQLPPTPMVDDVAQFCIQKKINLQMTS